MKDNSFIVCCVRIGRERAKNVNRKWNGGKRPNGRACTRRIVEYNHQMRLFTLLSCLHYVCLRLIFFLSTKNHLIWTQLALLCETNCATFLLHELPQKKHDAGRFGWLLAAHYTIHSIANRTLCFCSILFVSNAWFGLNGNVLREFHLHLNVLIFIGFRMRSVCNSFSQSFSFCHFHCLSLSICVCECQLKMWTTESRE